MQLRLGFLFPILFVHYCEIILIVLTKLLLLLFIHEKFLNMRNNKQIQ